jgi:hypothetical protein
MDIAGFRTRYPEFPISLVGDDVVTLYLGDAALYIGERFEEYAEIGTGYLVAHWVQLWLNAQAQNPALLNSGDVVSRSGGRGYSFSRSGAAVDAQQAEPFLKTAYGQQYVDLRDRQGAGDVVGGQSFEQTLKLDTPDNLISRLLG